MGQLPTHHLCSEVSCLLYFPGCMAEQRVKEVYEATLAVLEAAGLRVEVAEGWRCCGSVLYRLGDLKAFRRLAEYNSKLLSGGEVVTSCAGCYRAFRVDYPAIGVKPPRVRHTVEVLAEAYEREALELPELGCTIAYHHPCHLARHCGVYEEPVMLLEAMGRVVESSLACCGAGGGFRALHPEESAKVADLLLRDLLSHNPDYVATSCPFCLLQLREAAKRAGYSTKVVDVTQLIAEHM
ncbi:MAG: hypothetical protein DRN99_07410 [Thermoproteota archaeon]|nr:MAG: hypothetical protein DRN99_07410 [Candidatus Korarchaeota archaeon]